MSSSPEDSASYFRGAGGVVADGRLVARVIVGIVIVALAALVTLVTIDAADENSRYGHLRHDGVAVDVTVAGCVGQASGTGITASGFVCRGGFALNGHRYTSVITGSSVLHQPGEHVRGVADPRDPSVLATAETVHSARPTWRAFVTPALLFVLMVALAAGAVWIDRRPRKLTPLQ